MKRTKSVLFVDDDELLLKGLIRALRNEDLFIQSATNGSEAMDLMRIQAFDAIVSDNWMKGMCGTELLKWVGSTYPDTARILLTGQPNLVSYDRTEACYYCIVEKPVEAASLAKTIIDACSAVSPKVVDNLSPLAWRQTQTNE